MCKLSIITINRNNADGLRKTIESVVSQTYTDFEYIIIDGASTDDSVDVIKEYAETTLPNGEGLRERLYWVSEPDKGIYNAMNKGILKAKGEYLLFLNSGDWLYANSTLQLIFKEKFEEDIVYGDAIQVNENAEIEKFQYPEYLSISYLIKHMVCHQAIFHKKTLFVDRLYDEKYRIVADWEFLLDAYYMKNCTIKKINMFIVFNDGTGISSDIKSVNEEKEIILKKYFSKKILDDYIYFHELESTCINSTLYPFLNIFLKERKLQRIVKRFMKLILIGSNRSKLIPLEIDKLKER